MLPLFFVNFYPFFLYIQKTPCKFFVYELKCIWWYLRFFANHEI